MRRIASRPPAEDAARRYDVFARQLVAGHRLHAGGTCRRPECPVHRRGVPSTKPSRRGPDYRRCDRRNAFDEGGGRAQGSGSGFGGVGAGIEREAERRRDPGPSLPWSARAGRPRASRVGTMGRSSGPRRDGGILRVKCDACRHVKEVARQRVPVGAMPARYPPSWP